MKSVAQVLGSERNTLLKIIINWTQIAGISNREMMIPSGINGTTLTITVPNGMAAKAFVRFKHQIILNLGNFLKNDRVTDIRFVVDSSKFKDRPPEPQEKKETVEELSPTDVALKKSELESKGISPCFSESMAKLELLWQRKKKKK